jgi:Raf kinase inhibitor-like YbhB/YbcL family protein
MNMNPIRRVSPATVLILCGLALAAGASAASGEPFELRSPAVLADGKLPADFTCDGSRSSPPLEWAHPPAGVKSFAVTMHHIPGPGDKHVYWVVYNLPADTRALARNVSDPGVLGVNTVNSRAEYAPPCSKGPGAKKYTLTVYALSDEPKIDARPVTMDKLLEAIKDRTLATAVLEVTYSRASKSAAGQQDAPDNRAAAGPRAGGPPLERAFRELTLSDQLLVDLKGILDAPQWEKLDAALKQPPGPPPDGERPGSGGAPPPPPPGGGQNDTK